MQFIVVILIVIYLRKSLNTKATMPVWDKRFLTTMFVAIACWILEAPFSNSIDIILDTIGYMLIAALLYVIYKFEEFKTARFLYTAVLPYLVISILDESLKIFGRNFYDKWNEITGSIQFFAVIWGVGVWLVTRKQQKELVKIRAKALEEEQNNRINEAMKAQLEIQVAERTAELTKQTETLQSALDELKATQAQLIQSEKMASLGELTAGIAHEIQNPLNFVSNFSDVNNELIDEMLNEVLHEHNIEEINDIAKNIKENNSKIIFHGKRADAIVKGMLQHSRKSNGQKEPADINALCDEYLRLSYHGLRAKDKSFNANFKTEFDETIQNINIVPQDMGRVLLNLFNNAFYAVTEKKKNADEIYQPMVIVQTRNLNDKIQIIIKDNGNGIPENVIDKIFQPFFTTKPTGQGTGLGLSLTYDIITKVHNGTITVTTKKDELTEFVIHLPV